MKFILFAAYRWKQKFLLAHNVDRKIASEHLGRVFVSAVSDNPLYRYHPRRYWDFGWVHIFLHPLEAYRIRKKLAENLEDGTTQFLAHYSEDTFQHKLIRAMINPSWKKILVIAFLGLLMLAIAFSGIGALIQMGVIGGVFAVSALATLGKLTIGVFAAIASQLAMSTFTFTVLTTAIAGFLSCLAWQELSSPLKLVYNFGYSSKISKNAQSFDRWFKTIPLIGLLISRDSFGKFRLRPDHILQEAFKFIFNPIRWVSATLSFLESSLITLIDYNTEFEKKSSKQRMFLKAFVYTVFEFIKIPLDVLKTIGDIPFLVLKGIFYELPMGIWFSCAGTDKESNEVAEPAVKPVIIVEKKKNQQDGYDSSYDHKPHVRSYMLYEEYLKDPIDGPGQVITQSPFEEEIFPDGLTGQFQPQ